jgi:hypothetical protein
LGKEFRSGILDWNLKWKLDMEFEVVLGQLDVFVLVV